MKREKQKTSLNKHIIKIKESERKRKDTKKYWKNISKI